MTPVVAVIAPGMMGAAVGKRLVDNGLKVLTSLKGRSADTTARAAAAGMVAASDEEISSSDYILSILPPGDAVSLAERFVPSLKAFNAKPIYVDCNAINPVTVERVAAAIAPKFADVDVGAAGVSVRTVNLHGAEGRHRHGSAAGDTGACGRRVDADRARRRSARAAPHRRLPRRTPRGPGRRPHRHHGAWPSHHP